MARRVVADQPLGLLTPLPSGRTLGEALLDPTKLYASFVRELLATAVAPKFLNAITGHGFLAGEVTEGPRSLTIPSLDVEYATDELQLG